MHGRGNYSQLAKSPLPVFTLSNYLILKGNPAHRPLDSLRTPDFFLFFLPTVLPASTPFYSRAPVAPSPHPVTVTPHLRIPSQGTRTGSPQEIQRRPLGI